MARHDAFVGIVSDTHGKVRPEAVAALAGANLVIHAGDIGSAASGPSVLDAFRPIAHVVAVRGNNDEGPWADALPERLVVPWGGLRVLVVHDVKALCAGEAATQQARRAGAAVVVAGHSHKPSADVRDGVLWLNPGSAGPRRFSLPVTVARLRIVDDVPVAEIIELRV